MNKEIKALWLAALRSKKYKQTRRNLKHGKGHCCIGVLCDVIDPTAWKTAPIRWGNLPCKKTTPYEANGVPLDYEDAQELMRMNDRDGSTFEEIATYIEENL